MIFTLEALEAKHGDALVLYHGEADAPSIVVIDGGPHGVYRRTLRPRLESLRPDGGALSIPLMMVSHLDEDHIQGLVDLTNDLVRMTNPKYLPDDILKLPPHERPALPYLIDALWYNGFDRILGNKQDDLKSLAASAPVEPVESDASARPLSELLPVSVAQGLKLTDNFGKLKDVYGTSINDEDQKIPLILARAESLPSYAFHPADRYFYKLKPGEQPEAGALKLTVLGPSSEQLVRLHERWDADLKVIKEKEKKKAEAEGAAYEDETPFNLSSLVVLAEAGGKSMLLTGDARGDHVITSARAAGLLKAGPLHVNLLKLQHHGSEHNFDVDFFTTFTADHYVVSADGRFDNPSLETFEMLWEARADDKRPFTIHLTNKTGTPGKNKAHMDALVADLKHRAESDPRVTVIYRQPQEPSVVVHLAETLTLPGVTFDPNA